MPLPAMAASHIQYISWHNKSTQKAQAGNPTDFPACSHIRVPLGILSAYPHVYA
jgi:hypothetical protein